MFPDFLSLVKRHIGDTVYTGYFGELTRPDDQPDDTACSATVLEFLHYIVILFDEQIRSLAIFGANKEAHVYCLLRALTLTPRTGDNVSFLL
jgi:hypothetical protein